MKQLCFLSDMLPELVQDAEVPEWIQILPAGAEIQGVDGRVFKSPGASELISRFSKPIPVDVEHQSEIGEGRERRAIGWIDQLEERDGSVWAHVDWNREGQWLIRGREFRYISPAMRVTRDDVDTFGVVSFSSVGVVNHPNFESLQALNSREDTDHMDPKILQALGLDSTASVDDVVTAINSRKEKASEPAPVSFDKYVPRADYEIEVNARKAAEQKLKEREQSEFQSRVETVINTAIEAGKIAPASAEFYKAGCRSAEDLERLEKFVSDAPAVVSAEPSAPTDDNPGVPQLNATQLRIAEQLGLDKDAYAKQLAKRDRRETN